MHSLHSRKYKVQQFMSSTRALWSADGYKNVMNEFALLFFCKVAK